MNDDRKRGLGTGYMRTSGYLALVTMLAAFPLAVFHWRSMVPIAPFAMIVVVTAVIFRFRVILRAIVGTFMGLLVADRLHPANFFIEVIALIMLGAFIGGVLDLGRRRLGLDRLWLPFPPLNS